MKASLFAALIAVDMLTHSFILDCIIVGVCNACVAIALDFGMKYAHLLGFVRFYIVRYVASRAGMVMIDASDGDSRVSKEVSILEEFNRRAEEGKGLMFGDRIDYFTDLYWWVASHRHNLTGWLCVKCMSYRIFILSFIVLWIVFGFGFGQALQLLFIGSSANLISIIILTADRKIEVNVEK